MSYNQVKLPEQREGKALKVPQGFEPPEGEKSSLTAHIHKLGLGGFTAYTR